MFGIKKILNVWQKDVDSNSEQEISIDDIKQLLTLKSSDVIGVIIGRTLYSEALNLRESLKLVNAQPEIL